MAETPPDNEQNQDASQENNPVASQVDETQKTSETTSTVQDTELSDSSTARGKNQLDLEFIMDIPLTVTVEVGRTKLLIQDLLQLGQGSVIELHRLVGDELDFIVNGQLIAKGEVIVVNEKFGCKITEIIPPEDRIKYLGGY